MTSTYLVFYEADTYNPNRTYPQNFNRYARVKRVDTLDEARTFAQTVKNPTITDGINTMKRYPLT
jgi:hypothetical protein